MSKGSSLPSPGDWAHLIVMLLERTSRKSCSPRTSSVLAWALTFRQSEYFLNAGFMLGFKVDKKALVSNDSLAFEHMNLVKIKKKNLSLISNEYLQ